MNQKTKIQFILILLFVLITIWFVFKYIVSDKKIVKNNNITPYSDLLKNDSSNFIDEINYSSIDAKGNKYELNAKQGEVDISNSDIMFLNDVTAYVYLNNKSVIKIISDFGKYNLINYDTIFSKNVIMTYVDHKIIGEYLDFSLQTNLSTMSTDVVYTSGETRLDADMVEIDIATKDSKIFMNDNIKKVTIVGAQ